MAKYNSNGNEIWVRGTTGIGFGQGFSIATDSYGNSYTTGFFDSLSINFGSVLLTNNTSGNFFIVKYDPLGNAIWAQTTTGQNYSQSWKVAVDAIGNSYISGHIYQSNVPVTFDTITLQPLANGVDIMFLVKYNPCGHIVFAELLPSGGDDNNAVAVSPSGSIYIGGDLLTPIIFGNDTLNIGGYETVFVAKSNNTTSPPCLETVIIESITNKTSISIYPNPATTLLSIHQSMPTPNEQLIITDIMGTEVYKEKLTGISTTISISTWSAGIYFYEVSNSTSSLTIARGKFVVQK